jgi:hypothetical protein
MVGRWIVRFLERDGLPIEERLAKSPQGRPRKHKAKIQAYLKGLNE